MIGNIAAGLYGVGVTPSTTSFESIATVTVGSGGSSGITFSSIPSTYKHLQLRFIGRMDSGSYYAQGLNVQFNSDSGSNYAWHYIAGYSGAGTSVFASGNPDYTFMQNVGVMAPTSWGSNVFGVGIIDILDYANTNKYKTMRTLGGAESNDTSFYNYASLSSGLWRSTSAINSIYLYNYTFQQNSQIALYGIKD